jgi:Fe-S cluster assembly scaffold protein SufB|tara:strand:+ start:458 stop:1009 length:552 start_codon:yes stop_codon:yes gene_type:complete
MTTKNQQVKMIAEEIKETVRPLMVKWTADRMVYLNKTRDWIRSEETKTAIDEYYDNAKQYAGKYYSRSDARFAIYNRAGINQGDLQLISYYGKDQWLEKTQKQAEQKLMKIEVAVFKKVNFEVEECEKMYVEQGKDGYMEGAWKLAHRTNAGRRVESRFSFETFYAGGHNIQCLHVRTKYKLK